MKKLPIITILSAAFALAACNAVEDDAKNTPIGSVITGKTTDADTYLKRVSETNKALDKDTWRPQNDERF